MLKDSRILELDIDAYLQEKRLLVIKTLDDLVQEQAHDPHSLLFQAARYSLLSSGKQLRPILALASCETFNVPIQKALIPACALELIHTYSLIHDDLPCMDDDDLRRGKPTLHKVYNEGHAVLTGDFLLTYAFEMLSKSPHLSAEEKIALIQNLSENAGASGMIGGQVVDHQSAHQKIDWKTLEFMHVNKTSALIISALEFGAILGNRPEEEKEPLRHFGKCIGLAFQIVDDILDVSGSVEILGKPIGSDNKKEKATAVSVLGLEKATLYAEELFSEAMESLDLLSVPSPLLKSLAYKLVYRSA